MSIDIEQSATLSAYLLEIDLITPDDRLFFATLSGGVSNRAVLVSVNGVERWVVKQALEKLRVPVDWFSSPTRIHREAAGLRTLVELLPAGGTPRFVYEDEKAHILIMEAIPQPHTNWKVMLLAGEVNFTHVHQFAELLAAIHSHAHKRRNTLSAEFSDRHFFDTLRLEPYYRYVAQQVPQAVGFIEDLIAQTLANAQTLVHGDYSPKNILIHENRLVLLDHEVIHWGDPAFDIGFSMTHLLSKAHHVARSRTVFKQATITYWQTYIAEICTLFDPSFETRCVRHTLGCLLARVAGRSQLEYLSDGEKSAQRAVAVTLMDDIPATIPELIERFIEGIHAYCTD